MKINKSRKLKTADKIIEDRTIPEIIDSVKHIELINTSSVIEKWESFNNARKFPKFNVGLLKRESFWVNPNNQTAFNYGNFTHQDFIDWANGTGKAIKGNVQDEKDKFMRYSKASLEYNSSVFLYIEHLHKIDNESDTVISYGRSWNNTTKKSINLSNRRDSITVIREMLSTFVQPTLNDIKESIKWGRDVSDVRRTNKDFMNGVCQTLAKGGHGYFDACNTPTTLDNLSWSSDLVFAKAYSLYLEEIDPGIIECILWCQYNR